MNIIVIEYSREGYHREGINVVGKLKIETIKSEEPIPRGEMGFALVNATANFIATEIENHDPKCECAQLAFYKGFIKAFQEANKASQGKIAN